ncbi:MAG TPA: cob(I)yrinic acid a,c-diamide adenosyltransferase [Tepidisphaeraceae bacterium]|nr:cob(I)yrinic acid a,c-diamide adenosyltransferase [Tepidisphaeraceae bacterium]
MKIYTKTGDDGTTGLFGGGRVRKSDKRLAVYGTVDELNAVLGVARCAPGGDEQVAGMLKRVQNELFVVGSHLATPADSPHAQKLPPLDDEMVHRLEMEIDSAEEELEPLRQFILPGGGEMAARLHLARTVCRRAERLAVDFGLDRPIPELIVTYLNRLSDWLFVVARLTNKRAGVADILWEK